MATRIRYFDIAKGIAILCVILGHSILIAQVFVDQGYLAMQLYHVIFTFHMPLFFIISGYFMHPERPFDYTKRGRELLATYAITAGAIVVATTALAYVLRSGTRAAFTGWFAAAFYGAGDLAANYVWPVPFRIGALWFLLGLFWAQLIVHWAAKTRFSYIWIILSFVIGYCSARVYWLPLSIQSGMCAALFVYCGHLIKKYDILPKISRNPIAWIVACAIWLICIKEFSGFSMAMNAYGEGLHFAFSVVGAFAGTYCILGVSMLIDAYVDPIAKALSICGTWSLAILCVHLFEDDVTPWADILPKLMVVTGGGHYMWVIVFAVRLFVDIALTCVLYRMPRINMLFFPYLVKRQSLS
ncbi:acyltransferase [Bifidobacterium hapali]|uniref:Acyltransferase n=1 Tax=Bifidobacterium hapali TaxID=1630172 RepID=A0A261FWT6_9BIFI|nr:acyltransferase family protein [Bifidobacterium hapali]OZG63641.1 acyltransferase [Bifidobacterium hapali]